MDTLSSDHLLLALVDSIRTCCNNHVKHEDFISVSGFLSIDTDGKNQHRFVINEFIDKSWRDGYSTCLKRFDWDILDKKCSLDRSAKRQKKIFCKCAVPVDSKLPRRIDGQDDVRDEKHFQHSSCKSRLRPMRKSFSGSFNHHTFSENRGKLSNQTFTLDTYGCVQSPNHQNGDNPSRNFSSTTVNISNGKKSLCMHNLTEPKLNISSLQKKGKGIIKVNKAESNLRSKDYSKPCSSPAMQEKAGYEVTDVDTKTCNAIKKQQNHQATQGRLYYPVKCKNIMNSQLPKPKNVSDNPEGGIDRSASYTVEPQMPQMEPVQRSKTPCPTWSCKRNPGHVLQPSKLSSSEDSDVSIGSTRPKYLVQHNGELLLPCPKLKVKHGDFDEFALNNNRLQSLSRQSSEENVIKPSASHISSLINSIVGAFTGSNEKSQHDTSCKASAVSKGIVQDEIQDQMEENQDEDEISVASNATLNTISSLEEDSSHLAPNNCVPDEIGSCVANSMEITPKEMSPHCQQITSCPVLQSRKSRMLKWMKIFQQDEHHSSPKDISRKRNGSFTSLRSWSSLKSVIGFTSKEKYRWKKSKLNKHLQ